jgi:hypothetical protein
MRSFKQLALLALIVFLTNLTSFSQGCSDAGVCAINSIKDHSVNILQQDYNRNNFTTGITYGLGEFDLKATNPYVEYQYLFNSKMSITGKLTYGFINGELANTSNLGDLILTSNKYLYVKDLTSMSLTLGAKIPLNNANQKSDGNALPMHYQTSLGTYDLIIGLNYIYMDLGVSLALQQPLVNSNENEFIAPTDPSLDEEKYLSTNSYDRKGDLMGRISYNFDLIENKLILRPGVLAIYHLANDIYTDQNDNEIEITGSEGITLNLNVFLSYNFADNKSLELAIGRPMVTRDARPDGLTRSLVLGLEYSYSF